MGWYTVTKTINGRRYLYLQMTYRAGGKVKTKNKYLGPADSRGASFGFGAPANLPIASSQFTGNSAKPAGGLRIAKIRRLKPKTRAVINRDAARVRLEKEARENLDAMREARSAGLDVSGLRAIDTQYRRTHKMAFGRTLRVRKR